MGSLARELHDFMLQPRNYPDRPDRIEYRETHVSCLYFTGRFVYKVKKPVDLGFLDFRTLEKRRFFCREELFLNRRLCPDTYLETVEINLSSGGMAINGPGKTVEYAVKMVQLPAGRMLDRLLDSSAENLSGLLKETARMLCAFHRKCRIYSPDSDYRSRKMVAANWRENFSQTEPLPETILSKRAWSLVKNHVDEFMAADETVFERRQLAGWVRDGHGDLHSEHICLTNPIRIFDCIEFNKRFRIADVLADLAFLLMDLDYRKHPGLSELVLRAYSADWPSWKPEPDLLTFYKIYRAFVRGKVDAMLAGESSAPEKTRRGAGNMARGYFHLALSYLSRCTLILVTGLMGTGKTTLARRIGQFPGFRVLHSDVTRKQSAGISPETPVLDRFGTGLYSKEKNEETYRRLLEKAEQGLKQGLSVVVDASFADSAQRRRFVETARALNHPSLVLDLKCSEKTALGRLEDRRIKGKSPSDGRPELARIQARAFHPVRPEENPLAVDTEKGVDYNLDLVLCRLAELAGASS